MADTETEKPGTEAEKKGTPPWGADFDPERAWRLVENLRSEKETLKGRLDALEQAAQEAADAEKTEAQREQARAERAEASLKALQRDLYVERAVRKHDLSEDVVDFLTGETEEEILAKAERLAGLGKPKGDDGDGKGEGEDDKRRPDPDLKPVPGHGGEPAEAFDAASLARDLHGPSF